MTLLRHIGDIDRGTKLIMKLMKLVNLDWAVMGSGGRVQSSSMNELEAGDIRTRSKTRQDGGCIDSLSTILTIQSSYTQENKVTNRGMYDSSELSNLNNRIQHIEK